MSLRSYLSLMILATVICIIGLGIVLATIDPFSTNWPGFILFYSSLFLTIIGIFSILGFTVRFVALRRQLVVHSVVISFRQAFLAAFVIASTLFLLSKDLFSWMNVLLLIIGFSALEFLLISFSTNHN
ncbi:MAG: hypothetical protein ABIG10_01120 [bacterium]